MTCSFCNKSASKQYYLCDCCLVNVERCNATAKNLFLAQEKSVPVIPPEEDAGGRTIECDLYLGRYQEDELLQHRERCTTLLVFRCAVCHQDYMSKEGLWNHLDLHEVADENKQMEYQELRLANCLLKCVLCNDQRGYRERLYWQHVHEDHDGFFLQCSECEECFRSQKLLTDHALNHCNAREQAVPSISDGTIADQKYVDSQFSESSHDDSNPSHMEDIVGVHDMDKPLINTDTEITQPFVEKLSSGSSATKCPHCGKECFDKTLLAHHIKYRHPPTECDVCGIIFTSINQARYHKLKHHTEQKHKCPMNFHQKTEYQHHLSKHLENRNIPSEIKQTHHTTTILPDPKGCSEPDKHQEQESDVNALQGRYEFVAIKEEISAEETTLLEQENNVDGDATIINCPICGGQFGNKDGNHLAIHVEVIHQLSICTICGIIFSTADELKDHKDQQHSALCFNRDIASHRIAHRKSTSNPEPVETVKPRSSHYASSVFENPKPVAATVHEPDPSYRADEDVSNGSSFDGWEIYSTVPVKEIESYVLSIEFGFRFKSQNIPYKGKMRYYDCRRIKCRVVPQCDRKLLVFIPNTDADATISLKGKHTCATAPPKNLARAKLNEKDCELITNLVKSGVPSRDVRKHFRVVNRAVSNNQLRYAVQSALKTFQLQNTVSISSSATAENRLTTNTKRIIPEDDDDEVEMGECDICLEGYQKDELQEHRDTCMARVIFRCAVCNGDYVSMEGLWNHLVEHEIPNESKDLYYEEIRVTYNLHKCVLCNDQRGYPESVYWNHIHENHDGFFLRCLECGENFRSEKLKTDHTLNHCKTRNSSYSGGLNSTVVQVELPQKSRSIVSEKNRERSLDTKQLNSGICRSRCDLCYRVFTKLSNYNYHMLTFHSAPQHQCPQCSQKFHLEDTLQRHIIQHAEEKCKAESESVGSSGCSSALGQGNESNVLKEEDEPNAANHTAMSSIQEDENSQIRNNASEEDNCTSLDGLEKNESEWILSSSTQSSCESSNVKCTHCSKEFFSETSLINHIDRFHKSITCDICGTSISGKKQLCFHKLTYHTKPPYKCRDCPKQFHHVGFYQRHLLKHLNEGKFCDSCRQTFNNSYNFDLHKEQNRCVQDEVQQQNPQSELSETKCPHCNKQCFHAKYVVRHIENIHQPMSCDVCEDTLTGKNQLRYHKLRTHLKPNYKCPYCPKKFRKKNFVQRHLFEHQRVGRCPCKVCGRKFKNLANLKEHMKRNHGVKIAQISPTDHSDRLGKDEHVAVKEKISLLKSDENPVSEDDCEKAPTSGENSGDENLLVQHVEETHQLVICEICGMTFANADLLQHHKEKCHSEPNCNISKCEICDLRFEETHELQSHMESDHNTVQGSPAAETTEQTNPKFQCPHCPRELHTKVSYMNHMRFHKKAKIFSCRFCTVKCKRLDDLKAHIQRQHGGEINKCKDVIPVQHDNTDQKS
ncbi:zinc finger protein Xfin-like [Ochlerotatus camptorhynchus]|uniref:zinc finger protein Xfin-like n=1 Tax=Ochlerotatus camptorhynchus TaxID=644619 RepID=UPI0031E3B8A7